MNDFLKKPRTMRENSLKNLRPQKSGEPSRNPNGRPKKENTLLSCIKEELDKLSLNGVQTNAQIISAALVSMATKGNAKAIDLLMEYNCIKPAQALNLGNQDGGPVQINVKYEARGNASQP